MIELFGTEECEKWDEIVRSFQQYDVYYLSGYVKAFEHHGDGTALLVYFHNETTRAINVIMKRDIAELEIFQGLMEKDQYYDVCTPYGYGGFLIEGEDLDALKKEYHEFCAENHIICEFVRFHPLLENDAKVHDLYEIFMVGDTVCIDTSDRNVIWENITSKNRNMIRKAQRSGIKIFWGRSPELVDTFMDIYNQTMDKDHADAYYYFDREFYESLLYDLKQESMWFYAELDGKIIAMSIILFTNKSVHYHLSGSLKEYQNLAPSNLLLYEAACWACANGYKRFHLGGGVGSSRDSLYKFKKSFNRGEDTYFARGKKVYNQEVYDKLVEFRMNQDAAFDKETQFFPKYRG